MRKLDFSSLTARALVDRFATLGLAQDRALLRSDTAEYNRLYDEMRMIEHELKVRLGDQRRSLMSLYTHENQQVRLQAAGATLAVEPQGARAVIEALAASRVYPQAGHAGMMLDALDRGIFEPS